MTRDEINKRLKKTNIKGKDYVEVNQRILAFWELYPNGQIVTELVHDDGERCTFKAYIYDDHKLLATGHASEVKSASYINKTSYIENCETSAIGRALGILGIGISDALCSAEEVSNAIEQQERMKPNAASDLKRAQQRITAIANKMAELEGISAAQWYDENIKTRNDYRNDAETIDRICDELEEAYGE